MHPDDVLEELRDVLASLGFDQLLDDLDTRAHPSEVALFLRGVQGDVWAYHFAQSGEEVARPRYAAAEAAIAEAARLHSLASAHVDADDPGW